jgi:hypothetical protein
MTGECQVSSRTVRGQLAGAWVLSGY